MTEGGASDLLPDLDPDVDESLACPDPGLAYAGCRSTDGAFDPVTGLVHAGVGTYDDAGRLVRVETIDESGSLTSTLTQSWSAEGLLLEVSLTLEDAPLSGYHAEYTWTDDGQPATETWWYAQAEAPLIETWHYHADGALVSWQRDGDGDGEADELCSVSWESAADIDTATWDCDDHIRTLDIQDGRILEERTDSDRDGVPEVVTTTDWDHCLPASQTVSFASGSEQPRHDTWLVDTLYDADDRRVGQVRTWLDDDGMLDDIVFETVEAAYTCD